MTESNRALSEVPARLSTELIVVPGEVNKEKFQRGCTKIEQCLWINLMERCLKVEKI